MLVVGLVPGRNICKHGCHKVTYLLLHVVHHLAGILEISQRVQLQRNKIEEPSRNCVLPSLMIKDYGNYFLLNFTTNLRRMKREDTKDSITPMLFDTSLCIYIYCESAPYSFISKPWYIYTDWNINTTFQSIDYLSETNILKLVH